MDVPFRDAVWPKFLLENALGLLKLEVTASRQPYRRRQDCKGAMGPP
jgi:hypothetical protein